MALRSMARNVLSQRIAATFELEFASKMLPAIEINGSFYSLQTPASYAMWYAQTPEDFSFTVKGSRYITHMKRLKDVDQALANFFAQGIFNLREKLGYRGSEPIDARKVERTHSPQKRRRDVYCFFDNTDVKLRAPFDAQNLAKKLGLPPPDEAGHAGRRA